MFIARLVFALYVLLALLAWAAFILLMSRLVVFS